MEVVKTISSLLPWLGKPRYIMTFLFTVEIGGMTQVLASCVENVEIEPELFQARLCSLYFVIKYIVTKPHRIRSTEIMNPRNFSHTTTS